MSREKGILKESTLEAYLESRGVSRRGFLKFCSAVGATLALPASFAEKAAAALTADNRPPVVWLEFQDCAGDTESLLRATRPTAAELILDYLSLDYHETIMAAAGHQADELLYQTVNNYKGKYIAIVEGAIPTAKNGIYCMVGGRTAMAVAQEVCGNAAAIICVGTCSSFGGIQAAAPNPTGAKAVMDIISGVPIVNLPGCPVNVVNLTATVVHYLTFGSLPALDKLKRPLFAFGKRIHDNCERRAHFDQGQYVEAWGDAGHRDGWCLYKMGCKGPSTFHNCPTVRWNDGQSWPVQAGHGCVGCSEPGFWDTMGPFYDRVPNVPGFGADVTATKIGLGLVGAAAAGIAVHGVAKSLQLKATDGEEH
ncbi:twin-arginine translocation signal domain-containing protein [bacterium]|nr:MAG: twin-arginine translocation signal domain-containing protein [bacterium]